MLRQIWNTTKVDIGAEICLMALITGGMLLGAASFVLFLSLRAAGVPGIVSIIGWLLGGISMLCLLFAAQRRRTEEIAVRRACGASRGNIRFRFLLEALLLGFPGWLAGICLSLLILLLVPSIFPGTQIPGALVILIATGLAALFSLLISLLGGLYPAQKAASQPIVDALQDSGD